MKQKGGIWVPDGDTGILNDMKQVDGVPGYQLDRLDRALDYIPPKRRRRAIDVGAHVGLWTLHMSRYFKEVVAFEPVPENIECWLRNCGQLTNAVLHHEALGSHHEHVCLAPADGTSWSWTQDAKVVRRAGDRAVYAPCAPLDSLALSEIGFIKVDVEGQEFEVLQGAARTLCCWQPVVLIEEKHDRDCRASEYLRGLGMIEVWRKKHDRLFIWGNS